MNKIFILLLLVVFLPQISAGQTSDPVATIYPVVANGYWKFPWTWSENRVPNEDDIVTLDKPVILRSHHAKIKGLVIKPGGSVRGYSNTYKGGLVVTDYFKNNGYVGGNLRPLSLGSYIENNGPVSQLNQVYVFGGDLTVVGNLNMEVRLSGDMYLQSDLATDYVFYPGGNTIYSDNRILQFNHISSDLAVVGENSIVIDGASNEQVFVHGITATSSSIIINSDAVRLFGSIVAKDTIINSQAYMTNTRLRFKGDITIGAEGQLYGNQTNVRQVTYFNDKVTNYGTLGPYIYPHMQGDFINLGSYSGHEVRMQGSGDRNVVGVIDARIILDANQRWLTSPTIASLQSNGHTLELPAEVILSTSGIYDSAVIDGRGTVIIVDPQSETPVSRNVQNISAPDAKIVLQALDSRLGANITADSIDILNRATIGNSVTKLQATEISFNEGALVSASNYYLKKQITIETEKLTGTGQFGPYTQIRVNTSIPKGFTAGYNTKINLFQDNIGWRGTYRLSGVLTNFMSGLNSLFENAKAPNLATQLNTGLPHYFSYMGPIGWTKPLSVNARVDPFDTSSTIAKRNFFQFNFIPNQQVDNKVSLMITTPTDLNFSETVHLSNIRGAVYPQTITLVDGFWQGQVELFDTGAGHQIIASGMQQHLGRSGRSNHFANLNNDIPKGFIRGFVRGNDAVRADMGTLVFNSTTDGTEYTTLVNELGEYVTEVPAGQYVVSTTNALPVTVNVIPNETTDQDIVLNALCEPSDKVPVLLVPGIQGSDRVDNNAWFPKLYSNIPSWDSQRLEVHNPRDTIGFDLLASELELAGYRKNCTIFTVPYEWSLSILDSSEQFLQPWIEHAKQVSGSEQVDIVAHSMGGLVSRAYIQGNDYQDDVRKLAMAGTPNAGSAQAYFSWEGGDPVQADVHSPQSVIISLAQADQFQTNTLERNYMIKTGKESPCQFRLEVYRITNFFTEENDIESCEGSLIRDFLRNHAPAVGELFPTYEFLKDDTNKTVKPNFENSVLLSLNNQTCLGNKCFTAAPLDQTNVDVGLFVGRIEDNSNIVKTTSAFLYIDQDEVSETTYTDGAIQYVVKDEGDGTVIVDSVESVTRDHRAYYNDEHATMITSAFNDIVKFIIK